jgi:hypothetical protein
MYMINQGPALGARYSLPVLADGLLPFDDSLELDLGGDFAFGGNLRIYHVVIVAAEPRLTFHVNPMIDVYAKAAFGAEMVMGPVSPWLTPHFGAALGAQFRLTAGPLLRVEAGWPGVKIGLGWSL